MTKLVRVEGAGLRPVYLGETYPYTSNSDIYISSRILEVPEPFVDDVLRYIKQLEATKPVGYVNESERD